MRDFIGPDFLRKFLWSFFLFLWSFFGKLASLDELFLELFGNEECHRYFNAGPLSRKIVGYEL